MKRLLGCLLLIMIAMSACEGPAGPMGPPGMDGFDGESTQWYITYCEIDPRDWNFVNDDLMGDFFEYTFDIAEITPFVFQKGAVVCYLEQNVTYQGEPTRAIQTPLPYTFYGDYEGVLYSENYTYEVRPGYINFIVKISDFNTEEQQPLPCKFRVVLMW